MNTTARPLIVSGVLLGIGLGGFVDGIVFHQILQWHHMLTSAGYPADNLQNLELNVLADGIFHVATWLINAIGLMTLWRVLRRRDTIYSTRVLLGAMLIGWGSFNLVEGIIDHHILSIHHVRSGPDQNFWDIAFLVWGAAMWIGGWLLIRSRQKEAQEVENTRDRSTQQQPSSR